MIFKAVLLIALTAVAVKSYVIQQNDQESEAFLSTLTQLTEENEEPTYRKIIDDVVKEFAKIFPSPDKELLELKSLVDTSIKNATTKLQTLTYELAKQAETIIRQANSTLKIEANSLLQEVSVLVKESEALEIDAKHCTQGQTPPLNKLPSLYSNKLDACEGDKVIQGENLIRRATEKVQYAIDSVQQYSDDLKLCDRQEGVRVKLCRAQIALKIVDEKKKIPGGIDGVVSNTISLINSVYSEVQICTVNVNADFLNQGKQIIDKVERCIDDEINFKLESLRN